MTTALQNNETLPDDVVGAMMRLQGKSYWDIAQELGVSKPTAWRKLQTKEAKDIVDAGTKELIRFVPVIVKNYAELLQSTDESIKLKANEAVSKIIGIMGSHTSLVVNNIYNDNRQQILSPGMVDMIGSGLTEGNSEDIIDADFE